MSEFLSKFSQLNLPFHGVRCPTIEIDQKDRKKYSIKEDASNLEVLQALCNQGFKKYMPEWKAAGYDIETYKARVKTEVETLDKLGFIDYILIIWDVFNFCNKEGIATGLGRGSAAGSLVLYLLGVTGLDPIKYDLFFERFVSETRAKKQIVDGITYLDGKMIADIDSDICYYRRKEVIKYLEGKYPNKTSKMLTVTTLSGKALIKDCGKIIGEKDETEMNRVTSWFESKFGKVDELEETYDKSEDFKNWADENPLIYSTAKKIRDLIRNKGVHASGIVLSFEDLNCTTPTEMTSDKEKVSSFTMDWATKINIKLDLLGLKSISVIDEVSRRLKIDYKKINLEDYESIYAHLQDLKYPKGIFQIEADVNYKVNQKVQPKNLDQLSAVVALARPGALDYVDEYVKNLDSAEPFFTKELTEILSRTHYVPLYQEQMLQICHQVFHFTLDEAEILRRIVGKKEVKEMPAWKEKLETRGNEIGLSKEIVEFYWKVLNDSANYSFNKCLGLDTKIELKNGKNKTLREATIGESVKAFDTKIGEDIFVEISDISDSEVELFEIELDGGRKVECSMDHKFLCEDGQMRSVRNIISGGYGIASALN